MLGKQYWTLLTNEKSLVSQLYKARYFPKTNLLQANLGNNPSFIWRSIWEARMVISAGARWKVLVQNKVDSLVCTNGRGWDEDILRDLFNERDQECIRQIVVNADGGEDQLYWNKESTGLYSVRSAYRLLQAQMYLWCLEDNNSLWRKIWRVKAPPKVLNLTWRALSNILPTMTALSQKSVPVSSNCPVCNRDYETVFHVLVGCPFAKNCWQVAFPEIQLDFSNDFAQWLTQAFGISTGERRAQIVTMCWMLWKARNNLVWNQKRAQVNAIIISACQYLEQWKNAQKSSTKALFQHLVEGDGPQKWVRPQIDSIKVTVDAAMFNERKAFGTSAIARDHNGELIQAKTKYFQEEVTPEVAKIVEIKEALSWMKEQEWFYSTLESDSLVSIQAIRSRIPMLSPIGCQVEECRKLLRGLDKTLVFFIKRSANMAAHHLAREACSFLDRVFSRRDVPIGVENALMYDLS